MIIIQSLCCRSWKKSLLEKSKKSTNLQPNGTDITAIEELSIFCKWVEDGLPMKYFLGMVPLTRADTANIHSIYFLEKNEIKLSKLIGMGLKLFRGSFVLINFVHLGTWFISTYTFMVSVASGAAMGQ